MGVWSKRRASASAITVLAAVLAAAAPGSGASAGASVRSAASTKPTSTRPPDSYDKLAKPAASPTLSVAFAAPTGALRTLDDTTELRWLFDRPVVDLTAEAKGPNPSSFLTITPAVAGTYRWASTRMLVFTPNDSLRRSTTYTTRIAGLKALDGTTIAAPSITTFSTPTVRCDSLGTIGTDRTLLLVDCDQPVDASSLVAATSVVFKPVAVKSTRYQPAAADLELMKAADAAGVTKLSSYLSGLASRPDPLATLAVSDAGTQPCDSSTKRLCYVLRIEGTQPVDAVGRVVFKAGIRSLEGPVPGKGRTSGRVPTPRTPLIVTTSCRTSCDPGEGLSVETIGLSPTIESSIGNISVQDVTGGKAGAITSYELPTGSLPSDVKTEDELARYRNPLLFGWVDTVPGHTYRITLDPELRDVDGLTLGYRSILTVNLGRSSGFASIRSGERVLQTGSSGVRLRSRNVTEIEKVDKVLTKDDLVAIVRSYASFPKAKPLDLNAQTSTKVKLTTPLDTTKAQALAVGKAGEKGVHLVAVRATAYRAGSHYGPDGEPWTAADDAKAASRRTAATKSGSGTGVDGDGWTSVLVQRTDLGVTLKVSPANVHVSVTSLTSSKAVKGVKLSLYTATGAKPFATGTTDASGFFEVDAPPRSVCDRCEVIAVAEAKGDLAYAQSRWRTWGDDSPYYSDEGSSSSGNEVPGWKIGKGEVRTGSMFVDRGVYKLGETVYVKGVVRTQTTDGLAVPKGLKEIQLTVTDPQNLRIVQKKVAVSDRGSFDTTVKVPLGGAQGTYYVSTPGTDAYFVVTSYRKPDFVVDVTTKKAEVVSGDVVAADVDARYLFGAPMAGAAATTVMRSDSTYVNVDTDDEDLQSYSYTFPCVDSSILDCGPDPYSSDALVRNEEPLDDVGHQTVSQKMPVVKVRHQPYEVSIESEVADVSRQTFADRSSVLVHPGTFYFGVKETDGFATAGKPLHAEVVSVSPDGKRVAGKSATVQLVEWEWVLANRENGDGSTSSVGTYQIKTVETKTITTAAKAVTVDVTPPKSGMYELRVFGTDERGNFIESGLLTYAVGPGYVAWSTYDEQPTVSLQADRSTYKTGDTAHILIRSPWEKAEGILTVERGGVLSAKRFSVTSSASSIDVPISAEATPNEFATVTLFAPPRKPATGGTASGTAPDDTGAELDESLPQLQTATVELMVPPADKELDVKVATAQKAYLPGVDATIDVQVNGADGKPAASEVTLWAVDEGVLRLTGYTTPNLLNELYRERYDEVITADSRMRLAVLASDDKGDESDEDVAPGGGGGDSETADGVRTDFRTLAVWSASVEVGDNGKATVPLKLPQSLTSYRILAVATSGADRFGSTAGAVEVRKPFMLQPSVPRFVNVGDTFEAGVVVFNRTGTAGPVTVTATPDPSSPLTATGPTSVTLPSVTDKPVEVRFAFTASTTGTAKVVFAGQEGAQKTPETSDAVASSFPATVTQRLSVVATSGTVKAAAGGAAAPLEKVTIPADALPGLGGLEVSASTSALAGLQSSIASLVEYPYGCLEQRTSRIRVLLELSKLDAAFSLPELRRSEIDRVIRTEIRNLRQFSTSTGALSYWPGTDLADPYLTARTLVLLLDAKAAKVPIPAGMIKALTTSLQGAVGKAVTTNPDESWRYESDFDLGPTRALAAYALARAGKPEDALVDALHEVRYDLSFTERVFLLRAMLEAGETGDRTNALYADLLSSVRIENDRAFVQEGWSYDDWPGLSYLDGGPANEIVNTGELLSLLTRTDPSNAITAQLARFLVQARSQGTWGNTLESGVALHGLLDMAATEGNPKLRANIALGTLQVLDQQFSGPSLDVATKVTGVAAARSAGSDLKVSATGTGTLQWSARLRYAVPPARMQAVDQGFTIERSYSKYVPSSVGAPAASATDAPSTTAPKATTKKATTKKAPLASGSTTFAAGDLVQVTLRITSAQIRRNVAIEDLLPAGFEALNAQLATTSQENLRNTSEGSADSVDTADFSAWAAGIDHTEVRDDRVLLFATRLDRGSFVYTYVARATAPGTFTAPPAQVEEMYHPEVMGRTKAATVVVKPPAA